MITGVCQHTPDANNGRTASESVPHHLHLTGDACAAIRSATQRVHPLNPLINNPRQLGAMNYPTALLGGQRGAGKSTVRRGLGLHGPGSGVWVMNTNTHRIVSRSRPAGFGVCARSGGTASLSVRLLAGTLWSPNAGGLDIDVEADRANHQNAVLSSRRAFRDELVPQPD
jgi:hypothetical protein